MNEADLRKLDAIVGAAIRAVVQTGAGDEFVGAYAASLHAKLAQIIGHGETENHLSDLLKPTPWRPH